MGTGVSFKNNYFWPVRSKIHNVRRLWSNGIQKTRASWRLEGSCPLFLEGIDPHFFGRERSVLRKLFSVSAVPLRSLSTTSLSLRKKWWRKPAKNTFEFISFGHSSRIFVFTSMFSHKCCNWAAFTVGRWLSHDGMANGRATMPKQFFTRTVFALWNDNFLNIPIHPYRKFLVLPCITSPIPFQSLKPY